MKKFLVFYAEDREIRLSENFRGYLEFYRL